MTNNIVALDLGSSNTGIYQVGSGVVLYEPSLVAFSKDEKYLVKGVGTEAKKLVGRTTDSTEVIAPVFESEVTDVNSAIAMLDRFLNKITVKRFSARPTVVMSVPCGTTENDVKNFEQVLRACDVSDYSFVESPILTAIGLGLPMTNSSPSFIVDIGGGTTEIAAVSLDGVICGLSVNMGGMSIDAMLKTFVADKFGLKIGSLTAEKMKLTIGSLIEDDQTQMIISGMSIETGRPASVQITASDIQGTLKIFFDKIFQIMGMVMTKLPAEVAADIRKTGVCFSGGVSNTVGLEEYFYSKMEMRANVFREADVATILGGGMIAEKKDVLKNLRINKR